MTARSRSAALVLVLVLVGLSMSSCGGDDLVIGVSTSVRDTGLLDELVDEFKRQRRDPAATVKPVATASGQLIELARRGEVDILITHFPEAEAKLIADGDGIDRRRLMHNFFVLVGPPDDPAGARAAASLPAASFEKPPSTPSSISFWMRMLAKVPRIMISWLPRREP